MKRIIVSVTNDLSTDQRVAKICKTLHDYNFEVLLVGRVLKNSLPINRPYQTKRFRLLFNQGFLFYAEFNIRLFVFLLFSRKDVLLANDLDTLLPNYLVSFFQKKKLVYDSHELFSEIPELQQRPIIKKIWTNLENFLLPKIRTSYTVCNSIANYYNKKYSTNFKVIKNLPLQANIQRKGNIKTLSTQKKIILYQGAVNIGRGLELMIETMHLLPEFLLVIVGSGDILEDIKNIVKEKKLEESIQFLGRLLPDDLKTITPLAAVGISIEEDLGLNYRYALPNKIFDYIQAEVPILVSDLPEMKKIVLDHKVGEILTKRTPEYLAKQIKNICKINYSLGLQKAKKELVWEKEVPKLVAIFKK